MMMNSKLNINDKMKYMRKKMMMIILAHITWILTDLW